MTEVDPIGAAHWRDARRYGHLRRVNRAGLMWECCAAIPAISRGIPAPALRRAAPARRSIRWFGGYTFAEDPGRIAPDARIIWHANLDPATLVATAVPAAPSDPDAIDAGRLRPWLAVAVDPAGEHAVLSDGWRHIRIDIEHGSLTGGLPVILHYRLSGVASVRPKLLPLRQLIELCRHGRFAHSLYPRDARTGRQLLALRVHDALSAGASQCQIAAELFGADAAELVGDGRSDSLRSRVRRVIREARAMADGGWRSLMHRASRRER